MSKKVLYTTSYDDIIESISNVCNCSSKNIIDYLKQSQPLRNICVNDINLNKFFKSIGLDFNGKKELFEIIKFDSCVISHLTSRVNKPDESDIYCLSKALSGHTDLSDFLSCKELIFKETPERLITFYKNKEIDWDSLENSFASRINVRLRIKGKYTDNCINGFLFNDEFWKDSNVEHIKKCPEIICDICEVINRKDIKNEWERMSKSYAIGFSTDVKDIIFDDKSGFKTTKSKIYLIYKSSIYYLIQNYHNEWNPRFDNEIIRLKDNRSVSRNNIIGFYEVDR